MRSEEVEFKRLMYYVASWMRGGVTMWVTEDLSVAVPAFSTQLAEFGVEALGADRLYVAILGELEEAGSIHIERFDVSDNTVRHYWASDQTLTGSDGSTNSESMGLPDGWQWELKPPNEAFGGLIEARKTRQINMSAFRRAALTMVGVVPTYLPWAAELPAQLAAEIYGDEP
jgi:hypothetical protein